jgi:serine/threonine protein kinase
VFAFRFAVYTRIRMGTGDATREALPSRIGDRYRVERLLGRGGMASVYQVVDETTGRQLALKRLHVRDSSAGERDDSRDASHARKSGGGPTEDEETLATEEARIEPYVAEARAHAVQLFEREFDTLSQLVHPRIIEVYEYHRDRQGPYYTMELLDGGDLRERSPLPWREACRLLCDVCSAISLLHSRRLVHRDLTPLNIRCTRAGSAKLFDFGSMTPFGRSRHVVGTPPFVAPEALHGEIVDAQTDLFALGASAYYALTGRHAYPARQLLELPDVWRQPPRPPSSYVAEIPPALDELVLWLLEQAPSARPPSAAEIMERLSAIAGLDLREDLVVRQAYLSTPILVGREQSLDRLQRRLQDAAQGDGSTLVVTGPRGAGRSRLLDACVLEARLMGAVVLRADEADGGGRWSVARVLLRQLLAQAPEIALPLAAKRAAYLSHLLPEVDSESVVSSEAASPGSAGELAFRANTQIALRDMVFEVAHLQLVVVVVDDAHRIDEPSAAFLALIARETRERRMLLLASVERSEHVRSSYALQWLQKGGESIRVKNLTAEQTATLVRSLFGEIPNARLWADRIHTVSDGNPGAIMQIARQLVAAGKARYAAGTWTLPAKFEGAELALELQTRVDLSVRGSALWLARAVATCGGEHVSWNECLMLSAHAEPRRLIGELDELVAGGVLALHDRRYFVNGAGMRAALLRGVQPSDSQALHVRVAALYARRGDDAFRVAHHRWLGGDTASALDVLLEDVRARVSLRSEDPAVRFDYAQSLPEGWQATFRALIEACRTQKRSRRDRLDLQLSLLALSNVTAGYEPDCIRDVVAQLHRDSGLAAYEALDPGLPPDLRLMKALAETRARFDSTPEADRGLPVQAAVGTLSQVLMHAVGMAARGIDCELLAGLPSIAPLAPLSAALSIVQATVDNARELLGGRVLRGMLGNRRLLARLTEPDATIGMSDTLVQLLTLALHWSTAVVEATFGDETALVRADKIESHPLFAMNAWRVRALFALFQGDSKRAEECRLQTELLQIQNSPPQLFEGSHEWQMVLGYFGGHDLLRTKQCISDLEAMAQQFPAWQPAMHFAKGAYQALRGDGTRALGEFERALSQCTIGRHVMWPASAGGVLHALNLRGEFAESARRGHLLLPMLRDADLADLEFFVSLPLANAELELGRTERAAELLASAIESLDGPGRRNVFLGRARELQVRLAIRKNDAEAYQHALALCHPHYAASKNPRLQAKLEHLQRAAREAGLVPSATDRPPDARRRDPLTDGGGSMLATVLSSCEDRHERADRALVLLTRHSRCKGGFLYTLRREGPALVASRGEREPPPQLDALVNRFVVEQMGPQELTRSQCLTPDTVAQQMQWSAPDGTQFVPMLLAHRGELGLCVTGVAVMWARPEAKYRVPTKLLTSLSRSLQES